MRFARVFTSKIVSHFFLSFFLFTFFWVFHHLDFLVLCYTGCTISIYLSQNNRYYFTYTSVSYVPLWTSFFFFLNALTLFLEDGLTMWLTIDMDSIPQNWIQILFFWQHTDLFESLCWYIQGNYYPSWNIIVFLNSLLSDRKRSWAREPPLDVSWFGI